MFGLLALVLATVGLYAVLSLLVGQRTREFGIRLALGATKGDLGRLVLREAGLLVAIGILLGTGGALMVGRALDELLIGVKPNDALTLVLVVAAGLFMRTFGKLATLDIGLDREAVLVVDVDVTRSPIG